MNDTDCSKAENSSLSSRVAQGRLSFNPGVELILEEAGTTGNAGISLVVIYAESFFPKAFSSFVPVIPVIPVVLFAQHQSCVYGLLLYTDFSPAAAT